MKVFVLTWVGTKTRQLGQSNKRNEGLDRSASLSLADAEGKAATYKELYTAFSEECNKENDEIVLCGFFPWVLFWRT